ncbi:MAG: insulinase family protein [Clostridia bacterium]|nr:insulinase family protein [Clostridia bacterium]
MNYKKEDYKNGITFHKINTNKFKTNLFAIFLTTKLDRENVTKNALLTAVLRRGTKKLTSQEEISKALENMYGASFDCGVEKTGDNHVMKFYLESINNEFLPSEENLSKECLEILLDIVFTPYLEDGKFKQEYVDGEKENLKQIIQGKIDNKAKYAYDRCVEEMYKNEPYGLYKYGYIEDLEKIDAQNLYEYYLEMIKNVKIDIFVSGNLDDKIINELKESKIIEDLKERNANFNINKENEIKPQVEEPKTITESMQINQVKLIIGLDVLDNRKESKYATSVYNVILGGSANSKMFQNVREKASLAYTAGSNYLRQKDNVFVKCGIDIPNFDKALEIIKEQLKQMEDGDFTEEDIENAKTIIDASVGSITESQDSEITYYFSQELSDEVVSIEEYIKKINEVTKEQIVEIAKKIQINTIYFLKD